MSATPFDRLIAVVDRSAGWFEGKTGMPKKAAALFLVTAGTMLTASLLSYGLSMLLGSLIANILSTLFSILGMALAYAIYESISQRNNTRPPTLIQFTSSSAPAPARPSTRSQNASNVPTVHTANNYSVTRPQQQFSNQRTSFQGRGYKCKG